MFEEKTQEKPYSHKIINGYHFINWSCENGSMDDPNQNIECIDNKKLDRWSEVKNIKILNEKLNFEVESISTINYKENKDKILIYSGIQGENEDYITDYYYLYAELLHIDYEILDM